MEPNPYESPKELNRQPPPAHGDYSGCLYILLAAVFIAIAVFWCVLPAVMHS